MTALPVRVDRRQAIQAQIGIRRNDMFHEIEQTALISTVAGQQIRPVDFRLAMKKMGIKRIERPRRHRVRHLREPGQKVVLPNGETRNTVKRVGDNFRAAWKNTEKKPLRRNFAAKTGANFALGLRMQDEINPQRLSRRLPCPVIRRIADTAKAEYDIARGKTAPQRLGNAHLIIAQILHPRQTQPPFIQQAGKPGKMGILPLARKDFVAKNQRTEIHEVSPGKEASSAHSRRRRRTASKQ